jgi:L-ascorbate metabolism protein UlaG (beta-lactamase superfamily)
MTGRKGLDTMIENIHWLGHDTFKITGEKTIYTDPYEIKKKDTADIILITHDHFDHCSPGDVKKIRAGHHNRHHQRLREKAVRQYQDRKTG